jgi:hypothetical protein
MAEQSEWRRPWHKPSVVIARPETLPQPVPRLGDDVRLSGDAHGGRRHDTRLPGQFGSTNSPSRSGRSPEFATWD